MPNVRLRPWIACCIWGTLCLLLPAFAQTWNGLKLGGVPLGFAIAAYGVPLVLAGLGVWMASRQPTDGDDRDGDGDFDGDAAA